MKITSIHSMVEGVNTSHYLGDDAQAVVNLDDSSNESESKDPDARSVANVLEFKSDGDGACAMELDTPLSPEPGIESPKSPCVNIPLTSNIFNERVSGVLLSGPSPNITENDDIDSRASSDTPCCVVVLESPASPGATPSNSNLASQPCPGREATNLEMKSLASPLPTDSRDGSYVEECIETDESVEIGIDGKSFLLDKNGSPGADLTEIDTELEVGQNDAGEHTPAPCASSSVLAQSKSERVGSMQAMAVCAPLKSIMKPASKGLERQVRFAEDKKKRPVYKLDSDTVFGETPSFEKDKTDKGKASASNRSCFNCLGNHHLRDCTNKLDAALINKRRQEFKNNNGEREARYHEQKPLEVKYCDVKPGNISNELRRSMGLRPEDLPGYIYEMRKFGYPPGWLSHATDSASGLKFYGGDAVRQTKPHTEVFKSIRDSLVEYPGFTTTVPLNFKDCGRQRGVPFSNEYSLNNVAQNYVQSVRGEILAKTVGKSDEPSSTDWEVNESCGTSQQVIDNNIPTNWYDNLHHPTTGVTTRPARTRTDLEIVEEIYKNLVRGKRISPSRDIVSEVASTGAYNYRTIEVIEKMEEDRKKQQATTEAIKPRAKPRKKERAASPSLLDDLCKFTKSDMAAPVSTAAATAEDDQDDCVIIVEGNEPSSSHNRNLKRPLESEDDVIVIDSDSDDEAIADKKHIKAKERRVELYPNPLYKKPKMMENESSKGVSKCITNTAVPAMKLVVGTRDGCTNPSISKKDLEWNTFLSSHVLKSKEPMLKKTRPMYEKQSSWNGSTDKVTPKGAQTYLNTTGSCAGMTMEAEYSGEKSVGVIDLLLEHFSDTPRQDASEKRSINLFDDFKEGSEVKAGTVDILLQRCSEKTPHVHFSSLPPLGNFSKGMSEFPLQQEATQVSGRMSRVLSVIREKKKKSITLEEGLDDDDNDVQIIE